MSYNYTYTPSYNLFIAQNKQYKDSLSPEEWNNIINILAAQADNTALQVARVHEYLLNRAPDMMIQLSPNEPDLEVYENDYWWKVEGSGDMGIYEDHDDTDVGDELPAGGIEGDQFIKLD